MSEPTHLAIINAHPRDKYITFDEGPHIYTVHGEMGYTSVTTLNHRHFSEFDSESIIAKILSGSKWKNDPTYAYYKMPREQIQAIWDANRDKAALAGTKLHYDVECYYNGIHVVNDSIEYKYFLEFVETFPNLKPYRTEWMVYYEELKLSGSIDMVFEKEDGTLLIYDWKRVKEILYEPAFGNKFAITPCISHLPDTNFWHYSLQLNTYIMILEHKYGKKVVGLCLVCLHPDNCNKTFEVIDVPFLDNEMANLVELRRREVADL
jgi:hypothetical protein